MFTLWFDMRSQSTGAATSELYAAAGEMAVWAETWGCVSVLDHISAGPTSYVVGIGYRQDEFDHFGVPISDYRRLADENLESLHRPLRGETLDRDGRRMRVTPAPRIPGGPRLMWGGASLAAAWDEIGEYLLHDAMACAEWNPGTNVSANITAATTVEELRHKSSSHVILSVDEARRKFAEGAVLNTAPLGGGTSPSLSRPHLRSFAGLRTEAA